MRRRAPALVAASVAATAVLAALGLVVGPASAKDPPRVPPSPDLGFYVRRVAAWVDARCASCHRSGAGALVLGPEGRGDEVLRARARELQALSRFVDPGAPWDSRLVRKVLPEEKGGMPHGGGALLSPDDDAYDDLLDFVSGATLSNLPPEPEPGKDRRGKPGDEVVLDGSLSYDRDDDRLTFRWELLAKPSGSRAELRDADAKVARFTADLPGTYVASLRVSDGKAWSAGRRVAIEALDRVGPQAPGAVAASGLEKVDPASLRLVRAVYGATLGRPPTPPEAIAGAGQAPEALGATLLATLEAGNAWVEEESQRLGLVGDVAPTSEAATLLPARIAAGTTTPADAVSALATDPAFARAHDAAHAAEVASLLGVAATDRPLAERLASPEARVFALRRFAARYLPTDAAVPASRATESMRALAVSFLASPEFLAATRTARPASDVAFARALFADLLGRRPTAVETSALRRAADVLPDSSAGRSAVVAVLLDSGEVALPLVSEIADRGAWVADRFLRYVGRRPTDVEANAYTSALADPDGGPALVVRALLTSREYASR